MNLSRKEKFPKYAMPDSLFISKPAPGAILNDWTGMDFTVTMLHWEHTCYKAHRSFDVLDATRHIKPKGKAAKIGKHGHLTMTMPLLNGKEVNNSPKET
jgi:hypothetical protein